MASSSQKTRARRLRGARRALTPRPTGTRAAVTATSQQGSLAVRLQSKAYRHAYVRAAISHGVSHQIRTIREGRNLTQQQLARRARMKQTIISRLEDPAYGRFTLSTLQRIGEALDVALVVKYVTFSKFLSETADKSPKGLYVAAYEEASLRPEVSNRTFNVFFSFLADSMLESAASRWYIDIDAAWTKVIDVTPTRVTTEGTPFHSITPASLPKPPLLTLEVKTDE